MLLHLSRILLTALITSSVYASPVPSIPAGLMVAMEPAQRPAPLNQMHNWIIQLRGPDGSKISDAEITVSGGMPAHDHGLATSPQVTRYLGEGRYLLEGVRFHMPGEWFLKLDIRYQDQSFTTEFVVNL